MLSVVHENPFFHNYNILDKPDWIIECFGINEKFEIESCKAVQFPKKYDMVSDLILKGENISFVEFRDFLTKELLYSKHIPFEDTVSLPIWFSNNIPCITSTTIKVLAGSKEVTVEYIGIVNRDQTIV